MEVGRILPTEAAVILNVSPQFIRIAMQQGKRFRAVPEIRHKRWRELNLMQPLKPEETPDYSFRDLQMCIYHTITI